MKTLNQAVQETIKRLSEVPGTSVQVYAEDHILGLLNSAFKFIRMHADWPELMQWYTRTLDGATGKITSAIPNVIGPKDLRVVMPSGSSVPLPYLPTLGNPFRLTGTAPMYVQLLGPVDDPFDANGNKELFRIWPLTATGDVVLQVKHNKDWVATDGDTELWIDDEALILHACTREAIGDGANPAAQADFAQAFGDRLKQLTRDNHVLPVAVGSGGFSTPTEWFDPSEYG